jgi:transcriptional regulator with XRE-family HTH domain
MAHDWGMNARLTLMRTGLTQRALAREVGVTAAHLCRVLRGRRRPSRELVGRINVALKAAEPRRWNLHE